MKVRVLGCSGGLGGAPNRTTSFLVDHDILIDAGTGVGDLNIEELSEIRYVFLTHSHLDHIATLPILLDTVGDRRRGPVTVFGLPRTLSALRKHIFNWKIWPDFTRIPTPEAPFLRYQEIALGETVRLGARAISPLPAKHVVPTVGYQLDSGRGSLAFSGDTTSHRPFWDAINAIPNLKILIVETAFPDQEAQLARASKHYCPSMLAADLARLKSEPELYITHLKPGHAVHTMCEIESAAAGFNPRILETGKVFEF